MAIITLTQIDESMGALWSLAIFAWVTAVGGGIWQPHSTQDRYGPNQQVSIVL